MWDVIGGAGPKRENDALLCLRKLIAAEEGSISFERFMREALYHPGFGYYACQVRTIGRGGDFSTSATLHGALGQAVAAWLRDRSALLRPRSRWHVIELGAGGGQLADEILRGLGWWNRLRVRYHIVERSETLRREQKQRLANWSRVEWHDEIESALRVASGEALIFSNEFVDAFPCVRLEWDGVRDWREVRVGWDERTHALTELVAPWMDPSDGDAASESTAFAPAFTAALSSGATDRMAPGVFPVAAKLASTLDQRRDANHRLRGCPVGIVPSPPSGHSAGLPPAHPMHRTRNIRPARAAGPDSRREF